MAEQQEQRARGSYIAIIVGISGREFYLKDGQAIEGAKRAQRFRSERGAAHAASQHIRSFADCVARHMAFRVESAS